MLKLQEFQSPYPNPHDYGNWRACPGEEVLPTTAEFISDRQRDLERYNNRLTYCSITDIAWVICLYKAEVLDRATATTLIKGLQQLLDSGRSGRGGEVSLIPELDNNEDLASLINLGRTMQEPMSRLQLRDQLIDFLDYYLEFMEIIADLAAANASTIMPGHTHFSQANPITLANYLLSIFDNLQRGLEQLELSYRLIDKNSGGCGATSGTTWPVDRHYLSRLLGFSELLETTYDCEASQDHTMHLMFSLANIATTLSKMSMDIEIWSLEEIDMIRIDPRLAGVSSMMPQKSHAGRMEDIRNMVCDILGTVMTGLFRSKGEPHADVMAMYSMPQKGIQALAESKCMIRYLGLLLKHLIPQKDKMLEHVRQGYSCMTEVAAYLVRERGYGGRRAHRICAHLVRIAREQRIPAPQLTGALLDQAARLCEEKAPGLSTAVLQQCLDPVAFINNHHHTGGPAPAETMRMLKTRQQAMVRGQTGQTRRKAQIEQGHALRQQQAAGICKQQN